MAKQTKAVTVEIPQETTTKITLKLVIEYDLEGTCPEDLLNEIQEVIEKAREYGYPKEAKIESAFPIVADLDV